MHVHRLLLLVLMAWLGMLSTVSAYIRLSKTLQANLSLADPNDLPFPSDYTNQAPLFVVYHISMMGRWEEICDRQFDRILASGLLNDPMFQKMHVRVLGERDEFEKAERLFEGHEDKVSVVYYSENLKLYEYPSTLKVKELAYQHPDSKILYLHSKGVTRPSFVDEWSMYMEYFLLDHYDRCLWKLDRFAVASADIATRSQDPFFMGNFWWAAARHVNELPTPLPEPWWDRFQHERFTLKKHVTFVWSFHESDVWWYKNKKRKYNIEKYRGTEVGGNNFTITNTKTKTYTLPPGLIYSADLEGGIGNQLAEAFGLVMLAKRDGAIILPPTTRVSHPGREEVRGLFFSTFNISLWNKALPRLTNMYGDDSRIKYFEHKELFKVLVRESTLRSDDEKKLWLDFHRSIVPTDYIRVKVADFVGDKRFVSVHARVENSNMQHQTQGHEGYTLSLSAILDGMHEAGLFNDLTVDFVRVIVGTDVSAEDAALVEAGKTSWGLSVRTTNDIDTDSYLDKSMVDLEVAKRSVLFVGSKASTFSHLVHRVRVSGLTQ